MSQLGSWSGKSLLGLVLLAALAPAAGDVGLYLASRRIAQQFSRLDLHLTRPLPDSLKREASRYLRDSLGVTQRRESDTLVVRIPRSAERSMDGMIDSLRASSRGVLPWLIAAVVLLHAPLVFAVLVAIVWLADRERRERNFARGAPWHDAG